MTSFNKTYIIAEAGVNHNADIKLAFKLVDAAKSAGVMQLNFNFLNRGTSFKYCNQCTISTKGSGEQNERYGKAL